MTPIHNCIHASLENEYFKQKLTDYYKENRRLKEEIKLLRTQSETGSVKNIFDEDQRVNISTQTLSEVNDPAEQLGKGSTGCSTCKKKPLRSSSSSAIARGNQGKNQEQAFDNDTFNKQNKVIITQ